MSKTYIHTIIELVASLVLRLLDIFNIISACKMKMETGNFPIINPLTAVRVEFDPVTNGLF